MTILVNEYVDTMARFDRTEATNARRVEERELRAESVSASDASAGNGLTAVALVMLNVLLVAMTGLTYSISAIASWVLLATFVLASMYTANALQEMFGTDSIENIEE